MRLIAVLLAIAVVGFLSAVFLAPQEPRPAPPEGRGPRPAPEVLVFSRTAGFRHDSIPAGHSALKRLGEEAGFKVDATEDGEAFTGDNLRRYAAVIFLNTTGDVLNDQQQSAFTEYIRAGHGFVGVHAATDTEYDWEWYGQLVGARFNGHPAIQEARIAVADREHPSTSHLQESWRRSDEWYNFRAAPASGVRVLARLDESSYQGGSMNGEHPIAWCHEFEGGRAWYTGCGHTIESYSEDAFRKHLLGGILWAMNADAKAGHAQTPERR